MRDTSCDSLFAPHLTILQGDFHDKFITPPMSQLYTLTQQDQKEFWQLIFRILSSLSHGTSAQEERAES